MSDDLDNRQCGVPVEDIIDLVREELSPRRSEEVSRHVESCPRCLAEVESLRSVSAAARAVEIAPSPGFREKLMARVRETAHAERTSPVKGLRVVGPATRRLARIVERERAVTAWFRPRWKLAVLASSAAAVLAAVMISKAWVMKGPAVPGEDEMRIAARDRGRRAIAARFRERKECIERPGRRREATLDGSWLEVSVMIDVADDKEIVLTGMIDPSQHENCLLAFRATDWELFADRHERAPEGPELERYRAIARARHVVPVRGGRIEIPDVLFARHISGADVVVLRLGGRSEIWSRGSLKVYTQHGIPARIGVDLEG